MRKESFDKAQQLYSTIHDAQQAIKNIKWYENKFFKKNIPIVVNVPYFIGDVSSVDSHIIISDTAFIKDILNTIKIHFVQTIQNAEKELEEL